MGQFAFIFICLGVGFLLRSTGIFSAAGTIALNRFVIFISLPALTVKLLHGLTLQASQWPAVAMSWLIFLMCAGFLKLLSLRFELQSRDFGTLLLLAGLGNTSFVGFPVLEALIGHHALAMGVLIDQPGTFLVCGTLGIASASYFSARRANARAILLRILIFPPFLAMVVGLASRWTTLPNWLEFTLERLGSTMIPVSLVAVGSHLQFSRETFRRQWRWLTVGLFYKLLLAPIAIAMIYVWIFGVRGEQLSIVLLEAAMAPMITAGIIAVEYGLNDELSSLMISIGIPLAIALSPAVYWISQHL